MGVGLAVPQISQRTGPGVFYLLVLLHFQDPACSRGGVFLQAGVWGAPGVSAKPQTLCGQCAFLILSSIELLMWGRITTQATLEKKIK